jgi:ATP-dependent RNA helicase DeaD
VQQQLRIHEWDGKEGDDAADVAPAAPRRPSPRPGKRPAGFKPRPGGFKPPRR